MCGEKFEKKEDLKIHNKKAHGDEMSEAVDQMKSDQQKSAAM